MSEPKKKSFRWLFSPRTIGRELFCLACLATIVALFYAEENWRGKHAWESYVRQSKARGIDLDWHHQIPPFVQDDKNFAMIPLFKPLFDYKWDTNGLKWPDTNWVKREGVFAIDLSYCSHPEFGSWEQDRPLALKEWQIYFRGTNFPSNYASTDLIKKYATHQTIRWDISPSPQEPAADILLALKKFDSNLNELRLASARPYSRFPIHYEDLPNALLVHLSVLAQACNILQLRAIAELSMGNSQQALADLHLAFYCADATKTEPFMASQLVRSRIITENLQPIWEGLRARRWPDQSLAEIQQMLSGIDLLPDFQRALKSEPAFLCGWIGLIPDDPQMLFVLRGSFEFPQQILGWLPRGWYYQNQLFAARFFQEKMQPDFTPETERAYPSRSLTNLRQFEGLPNTLFTFVFRQVGTITSPQKMLQAQTGVNLARIACALERWRMAHGNYPQTLDSLVPNFLDRLPHDIISGEPLKYRLATNGQFVLYSVGWNEKDDGGIFPKEGVPVRSGNSDFKTYHTETGDWVWRYTEDK